jgi:hypothetical protein
MRWALSRATFGGLDEVMAKQWLVVVERPARSPAGAAQEH